MLQSLLQCVSFVSKHPLITLSLRIWWWIFSQAGHGFQSGWNRGLGHPRRPAGRRARRWSCAGENTSLLLWQQSPPSFSWAYIHHVNHLSLCPPLASEQQLPPWPFHPFALSPLPNAASVLFGFRPFLCLQVVGAPITTQVFFLFPPYSSQNDSHDFCPEW